jgi:hypothetical protein
LAAYDFQDGRGLGGLWGLFYTVPLASFALFCLLCSQIQAVLRVYLQSFALLSGRFSPAFLQVTIGFSWFQKSTGKVQVKLVQTTGSVDFAVVEFCWTALHKKIKIKLFLFVTYRGISTCEMVVNFFSRYT